MNASLSIAGKYALQSKIGNGSFGEIYRGVCLSTGKDVAIKLESKSSKHSQLEREAGVYKALQGIVGVPTIYHYSVEEEYNALVMDLLGPSLEDLFNFCRRKFSTKTVLMLAIQMLHRLEQIHEKHLISRDIKPDNFLMGRGPTADTVFLIDYGLAKPVISASGKHIDYLENKKLSGTVRYASINMHIGVVPTRRDDLEGLGYVLLYFLTGNLPWQGMKGTNREFKYLRIAQSKMETSVKELCHGYTEFEIYITYCRSLLYNQKPDYGFLRGLFIKMFNRLGYVYDFDWDWKNVTVRILKTITPNVPSSTWGESPKKRPTQTGVAVQSKDLGWGEPEQNRGWGASSGWQEEAPKQPQTPSSGRVANQIPTGWDSPKSAGRNEPAKTTTDTWGAPDSGWGTPEGKKEQKAQGWGDEATGWGAPEPVARKEQTSQGWGDERENTGWGALEPTQRREQTTQGWGDEGSGWGAPEPAGRREQKLQGRETPEPVGRREQQQKSQGWGDGWGEDSGWGTSESTGKRELKQQQKSQGWGDDRVEPSGRTETKTQGWGADDGWGTTPETTSWNPTTEKSRTSNTGWGAEDNLWSSNWSPGDRKPAQQGQTLQPRIIIEHDLEWNMPTFEPEWNYVPGGNQRITHSEQGRTASRGDSFANTEQGRYSSRAPQSGANEGRGQSYPHDGRRHQTTHGDSYDGRRHQTTQGDRHQTHGDSYDGRRHQTTHGDPYDGRRNQTVQGDRYDGRRQGDGHQTQGDRYDGRRQGDGHQTQGGRGTGTNPNAQSRRQYNDRQERPTRGRGRGDYRPRGRGDGY